MRDSTRLVTGLAAVLLTNLALTAGLEFASAGRTETVQFHDGQFIRGIQGADSWKPMEIARTYLQSHRGGLYEALFFGRGVKFQYPPTSLLFVGTLTRPSLNVISWVATLLTGVLVVVIFRVSLARQWPGAVPVSTGGTLMLDALVLALALTFYPLMKAYSLGQIQTWLDFLFAAVILAWLMKAPAISGIALGLMCLVKPTYALLLLWPAIRGEWRLIAAAAGVMGAGLALSIWRIGLHDHVEYARVLSYIARRGEAFYANQSFNGLLNRLLFNGSNLDWQYHEFAPVHPIVLAGTATASIALLAVALALAPGATAVDLSILALTITLTAPIAWEHHYGVMLPMYAVAVPPLLAPKQRWLWTVPALWASYALSANYFQFTDRFAHMRLNPVQSYLLVGALVLLGLMYVVRGRKHE